MTPLLSIRDLVVHYRSGSWLSGGGKTVYAVNGVSLTVDPGETLALVGESGCGKSSLGRAILRLHPPTSGTVSFEGQDLLSLDRTALRAARRRMQIVFQDPYSSLNPRLTVGDSVAEGLEIHRIAPKQEIPARVGALLEEVGLDPAMSSRYPHEFSGGQRQRIGIARALAVEPVFLVCDEPVSALDVSVQAQVLNLFLELQRHRSLAYLFIAHDLAVVRQIAHRVAVMYMGRIVELGRADAVIERARHPYTVALLSAVPVPDPERQRMRIVLPGDPPSPTGQPAGCPFAARCFHPAKDARCTTEAPALRVVEGREVACHYAESTVNSGR
jgi:peptide/nickel transport system ATP-binding protein/oligopeptide transport system ATP-binding protein